MLWNVLNCWKDLLRAVTDGGMGDARVGKGSEGRRVKGIQTGMSG